MHLLQKNENEKDSLSSSQIGSTSLEKDEEDSSLDESDEVDIEENEKDNTESNVSSPTKNSNATSFEADDKETIRIDEIRPDLKSIHETEIEEKYGEKKSVSTNSNNSKVMLAISIAIFAVFIYFVQNMSDSPTLTPSAQSSSAASRDAQETLMRRGQLKLLEATLDELKAKYNQTDMFWAHIQSSFQHSVIKGKDPSVVMFVNDRDTENFAQKLIYDIVDALQHRVLKQRVFTFFIDINLIIEFRKLVKLKLFF